MPPTGPGRAGELAALLRAQRDEILAELAGDLGAIPRLRALPRASRVDHLPVVLDRIIDAIAELTGGGAAEPPGAAAAEHAAHRAANGADLADLVAEYTILRRTVVRRWAAAAGAELEPVALLDAALDAAVTTAVERFTAERDREARELARLRDEARRLAEILELGDACFALDAGWRIQFFNRKAERLTRRRRDDVLGGVFWELWPEAAGPGSPFRDGFHRSMERREPVEFDAYYAPLEMWTAMAVYPTADGGIAVFFRDATERKAHERALAETATWRQRLIGILGHDLRTPLNTVLTSAQLLLRRGDLAEDMARPLGRIEAAVQRMARMITDVLDWTRIQLGAGIPVTRAPADLAAIAARVAADVEAAPPVEVAGAGAADGAWDERRLEQLVQNLVENAVRHAAAGTPVRLAVRGDGDAVELAVHNDGPPIPAELRDRLFEPFVQAGGGGSLGLGLYIAREIARAHGGDVDVRSSDDAGTTFTVRLPRRG